MPPELEDTNDSPRQMKTIELDMAEIQPKRLQALGRRHRKYGRAARTEDFDDEQDEPRLWCRS